MELTFTFNIDLELMGERLGLTDLSPETAPHYVAREMDFIRGVGITLNRQYPKPEGEPIANPEPERVVPEVESETEPDFKPKVRAEPSDFQSTLDALLSKYG